MKEMYLDCFSGISGDMLLGALIDAGWPEKELFQLPHKLDLERIDIGIKRVTRNGICGIHISFNWPESQAFANLEKINALIDRSSLESPIKDRSKEIFRLLANSESKVHNISQDQVHFHEIGAIDTIMDVVGVISAIDALKVERIVSSPLPVGSGWVRCEHGLLPIPVPAAAELLRGVPVYGTDIRRELVTPTGAVLLKALAQDFGPFPEMVIDKIGYGAGSREDESSTNLLRVWIGHSDPKRNTVSEIRSFIDDMNPEWMGFLMERLFSKGALDVVYTHVQMKKNRPGVQITVLSPPELEERIIETIFRESTSSGVRITRLSRATIPRKTGHVHTKWGKVTVKIFTRPGERWHIVPEYEACRAIAIKHGVPIRHVYREIRRCSKNSTEGLY